jgi:cell division protein FtsL
VSPASKEEIQAVVEETRRLHDSAPPHRIVDAQGREPEQPVVLTEKMRLSWPLVAAVIALTVTVAGSFARGQALAQQVDAAEANARAVAAEVRALQLDAATRAAESRAIVKAIESLEKKIDKLAEKVK